MFYTIFDFITLSPGVLGCLSTEFQCNSTTCIDLIRRCDRVQDCSGGQDEEDCSKYLHHVTCV